MKKLLLLCLMALCALTTWAGSSDKYDFCVDGIYYYKLSDGSVAVIDSAYQKATSTYTGDLVIPSSVTNPDDGNTYTVSSIFEWAFCYCTITTISIPKTVTSLGGGAFYLCGQLTELSIPDGPTSVAASLCYSCTSLKSVKIPNTITSIGENAFYGCTKLEEINIPNGVTEIGASAFQSCSSLTEITIPEKVTSIGGRAFCFCSGLDKVYSLNPDPPVCGSMAFTSASTCTLYVPHGYLEVYSSADTWSTFSSIVEIDETITPPTVTTTAVSDITNSTATLHGTVSAGSEEILEKGFQYWADANAPQTIVATSVSDDEISSTIQRLSSATEYTFRAYATTTTETTYGDRITFTTTNYDFAEDNSDSQTIYYKILSSSGANRTCEVQYLYYASADNIVAYEGELTIPETVTHEGTTYSIVQINEYAFYECRNLTKVTIPTCITAIGPNSFQNCTSLEEATFPNTVSTIWEYTFDGCTSLKEAIIPSSVATIRQYAFQGCNSVTEITVPGTVKTFYTGMFANCANLKKVTVEEGVTNTGYSFMFSGCTNLKEVHLPNSLAEIANYTFYECTSLEEIILPNSITSMGGYSFGGCTRLKNVTLPRYLETLPVCIFNGCTSLEEIALPSGLTHISTAAFAYCTGLKSIKIPESVTTLSSQVFEHCTNLEEVTFAKNVTSVNYQVCHDCPNLATVFSLNTTPPVCENGVTNVRQWFEGIKDDCILYVPIGSREEYASATGWKDFGSIVEIDVLSAETAEATDITKDSATLNGAVTKGTFDVTSQGFEYWTDPLVSTFIAVEDNMTTTLSDLEPSTTYYYRAYATDITGTTYGDTLTFTTEDDVPDGIDNVGMSSTNSENIEGIYSTSGQKLNTTMKGVNIIRYTDGTTKKVLVK